MNDDMTFTDQELNDAQTLFFRNCYDAAIRLANISADNLSQMLLKASVDGNEADRFILTQAREMLGKSKKREEQEKE